MKKTTAMILSGIILISLIAVLCSCDIKSESLTTPKLLNVTGNEEIYSSQYIETDAGRIIRVCGDTALTETSGGMLFHNMKDDTQQKSGKNFLAFSGSKDGIWYLCSNPDTKTLDVHMPAGAIWKTKIPASEYGEIQLIPASEEALLCIRSEIYLVTPDGTISIGENIRWSAAANVDGHFLAVGSPKGQEPWKDHLYMISKDETACLGVLDLEGSVLFLADQGNDLIAVTDLAVYRMTESRIFRLASLVSRGIDPQTLTGLTTLEDGFCLYNESGYFLFRNSSDVHSDSGKEFPTEKDTVTVACAPYTDGMRGLLALYNQQSNEVTVELTTYDTPELFSVELMAGKRPDLICAGSDIEFMRVIQSRDLLVPITPLIDQIVTDDAYFRNIINVAKIHNEIYYFPLSYELRMFKVPTVLLNGKDKIETLEELDQVLSVVGPDTYSADKQSLILSHLLMDNLNHWVDYEMATCEFDSLEFGEILQYCKRFVPENAEVNWDAFNLMQIDQIYGAVNLQIASEVQDEYSSYGTEVSYIPTPLSSFDGASISGDYFIAKTTDAAEAADDVIAFLLSDQAQEYLRAIDNKLPIKRSAMETNCTNTFYYGPVDPIYDAQLVKLIERADHYRSGWQSTLTGIVLEEADYYFAGAKTLEDTQAIIQNRVELYLSEQK